MDRNQLEQGQNLLNQIKDLDKIIEKCNRDDGQPKQVHFDFGGSNVDIILRKDGAKALVTHYKKQLVDLRDGYQKEFDTL